MAHPKDKAVEDGDAERDADYKEDSTSESDSDNSTSELMAEEKALLEPNKRQRVTKKAVAPAAASTAAPMRTPNGIAGTPSLHCACVFPLLSARRSMSCLMSCAPIPSCLFPHYSSSGALRVCPGDMQESIGRERAGM